MLIPRWHTRTGNRLQTWRCKGPNFWRNGGGTQLQVGSSLAGMCCWEKQSSWKISFITLWNPNPERSLRKLLDNTEQTRRTSNMRWAVRTQEGSTIICSFKIIIGSSWERKTGGYQRLHRQANLQAINDLSSSKLINIEYILQLFTILHPGGGTSLRRKTRTAFNRSLKRFPSESVLKNMRDKKPHQFSCGVKISFLAS